MRVCRIAPLFKTPCRSDTMELTVKEIHLLAQLSRDPACMLSARAPISTHCKSSAYCNGLTRVHRLRRLKKIHAHCSDRCYSVAGSIIFGLQLQKTGASLSGQKSLPRLTRSTKSNGRGLAPR